MATSNPMVPTPTAPKGMSQEEAMYRGIALSQLNILRQRMQLGKLNIGKRTVKLANGVEIHCNICFNKEDVYVNVPVIAPYTEEIEEEITTGFAVHPRSTLYPTGANFKKPLESGGYEKLPTETVHERPDGTTYTTPITTMFPLYDNDHGTMLIYKDGEWKAKIPPENYGIHAFTNESSALTWRGWPSITLGNSRDIAIEGVTKMDVQTAYNTFYTPLDSILYSGGSAVSVPGKVRGAGISEYGTVFVSTVNYTQYDFVGFGDATVNPDGQDWLYDNPTLTITDENKAGKVGNYYDELYIKAAVGVPYLVNGRKRYATSGVTNQDGASVDGWLRIGHRISPITNLLVWFSVDAKSANEDGGTWSWSYVATPNTDKTLPQGTFTSSFAVRADALAPHQYTVFGTPNPWRVTANTSWHSMYMLTKYGTVTYIREDKTIGSGITNADGDEFAKVKVYNQSRPDPTGYYIDVTSYQSNDTHSWTFVANNFKSGPFTWSGATPVSEGSPVATLSKLAKCVHPGTVGEQIPVTVTDNCGFTTTITYTDPVKVGDYVLRSSVYCSNVTSDYYGYFDASNCPANAGKVIYSDSSKTVYIGGCWVNWGWGTEYPISLHCGEGSTMGSPIVEENYLGTDYNAVWLGVNEYDLVCTIIP